MTTVTITNDRLPRQKMHRAYRAMAICMEIHGEFASPREAPLPVVRPHARTAEFLH